jgi:rfaE bifunctional protein kinase chain/domain
MSIEYTETIKAFEKQRILVVGDVMLDRYVTGIVSRISPEAPVPVVQVRDEQARPGGAANVALNIKSLGGQVVMAGLVGQDQPAAELLMLLSGNDIDGAGIVSGPSRRTTVKTRVVAERQQIVRIDTEESDKVDEEHHALFCERLDTLFEGVTGIIIEDYGKGVVSQEVVNTVLKGAREQEIPVALDPNYNHRLDFTSLELATPNYVEACAAAAVPAVPLSQDPGDTATLRLVAEKLLEAWHCHLLIITLGPHGMYLVSEQEEPEIIPTRAQEVFDVSGAGDTVIAAATLALACGADKRASAILANHAAGVVVGKLGTATCDADELLASLQM